MISFILVKKVTIEYHDEDEGNVFKFVRRPLNISTSNELEAFVLPLASHFYEFRSRYPC